MLAELLPASSFRFRGFTVFRALEVTDQEVLSSLKRDLIEKESIVSQARFEALQSKLRTLFHRRDLRLGLAAIDGDRVFTLNYGAQLDHECIFADSTHHKVEDFEGSIYMRATLEGKPLFIDDLAAYPDRTDIEEGMLEHGVRNIVVAPLLYQDQTIGSLSLSSPHPGDLNALQAPKLQEILPLFSMAVKRSMDELENRIQALIKEKCTAIHPVVEWRFRQAVLDSIESPSGPEAAETEMEEIVFRDVYPFYAIADIRGSSTQRSWSIQADLLSQLGLARDVLRAAHGARALPILDQLGHRIDTHMGDIEVNLRSGDEMAVVNFLRGDIESLFEHLAGFGPEVRERIEAYRRAVDPQIGTVYAKRKDFEASVTTLTDAISAYVDIEEHGRPGHVPALLREAEDRRRRLQHLRRRLAPRGRIVRSPVPPQPPPLAAHGGLRHRHPRRPAEGRARRAARGGEPDPRPAPAAGHPVPRGREALRRRRRVQRPLRDHQEADRQGGGARHRRAPDPAWQDRPGPLAGRARRASGATTSTTSSASAI